MNHIFYFFISFAILMATDMAQNNNEFYYWYKGEKQPLKLINKQFLLLNYEVDSDILSQALQVERSRIGKIQKVNKRQNHTYDVSGYPDLSDLYWAVASAKEAELNLSSSIIRGA